MPFDDLLSSAFSPRPLHVAFVCIQNANRSQMAQAWAGMLGGGRIAAYSAGIHPAGAICPQAVRSMAELGYDMAVRGHVSKSTADLPGIKFDAVIAMGCSDVCPRLRAVCRDAWAIPDARHLPEPQFRAVRNLIGWRVYDLMLDLGIKPERSVLTLAKPHLAKPRLTAVQAPESPLADILHGL